MSTLWLWSAGAILTLALLGMIPGIREIIKPLIGMVSTGIAELFKHTGGYLLWAVKSIIGAHIDLVRHLAKTKEHFYPQEKIEEKAPE